MSNPVTNREHDVEASTQVTAPAQTRVRSSNCARSRGEGCTLLATERRVLEMVVRGSPLPAALVELTAAIEELAPGMLASVLQLDPDGVRLFHGAAPSLPAAYRTAIDGGQIGPNVGSCGSAAYERRVIVAADIASDPRWQPFRELALQHGLRACWSAPIFAMDGRVLGTFALYYREPRVPGSDELELIAGAAHIASVVIERCRMDAQRDALIEDLSRAVRFGEMFAGVLSHDLRNPLSAVAMTAQLLRRNPRPDVTARSAERIVKSTARINRMIEQLLDFNRIRLGRGLPVEPQTVDVFEVCHYVADEIGGGGERRDVRVGRIGDTQGRWDRDRLLQLISNLVGNAAQHGATDTPIEIDLDGNDARWLSVTVTNTGEIPAATRSRLFDDPFRRGTHDTAGERRGLGLGLFISRHIAEVHGGTIEVTSGGGKTIFAIRLPRGEPLPAAPPVVTFDAA